MKSTKIERPTEGESKALAIDRNQLVHVGRQELESVYEAHIQLFGELPDWEIKKVKGGFEIKK